MDYQDYKIEFERKFDKVIGREINKHSQSLDHYVETKNVAAIRSGITNLEKLTQQKNSRVQLVQIYYDVACAYSDLRVLENSETYLAKEILNYRKALEIYENDFDTWFNEDDKPKVVDDKQFVANYIAMRCYNNIGNTMRNIGRFISAIDYFYKALSISNDFAMASINMAYTLYSYAPTTLDPIRAQYYHHACHYYYRQAKRTQINLEDITYLSRFEKQVIEPMSNNYPIDFFTDNSEPFGEIDDIEEDDGFYRRMMHHFFIDLCADFQFDIGFSTDSVALPLDASSKIHTEYIGLYNQMKQEFMTARFLLFQIDKQGQPTDCFADKSLAITELGDGAIYNFKEELLRMAYRGVYSIMDRIGYFLNQYFNVGLKGTTISFKNVWRTELKNGKKVPHPLVEHLQTNLGIKALFWLQKDVYEDNEINITSPYAEKMYKMRNDMEHNSLRTIDDNYRAPKKAKFTKYSSMLEIGLNVERLLLLIREALIYVAIAVEDNEKKQA